LKFYNQEASRILSAQKNLSTILIAASRAIESINSKKKVDIENYVPESAPAARFKREGLWKS
jgi:hypothetical protein